MVGDYHQTDNIWALVNKTSPIPTTYIPANLKIPNVYTNPEKDDDERSVRTDIEQPLIDMFNAAQTAGYSLMIGSGYRSANLQATYFNSLASSVGETAANQSIAKPGQSEHQTGLAVDISTIARNCYLSDCFAETNDGIWLINNSYKYGFILRYPEGKESITEYNYEPWHFRYVGIELATALHESKLTLDEAWPYLETARSQLIANEAIVL
jgi:D-alanyl-D-alanine carboxypeptidase